MINGHVINETVYWQAFIGNDFGLNTKIIDRVEIIRGPGSALYGAGAMLSVINIITKIAIDIDGLKLNGSLSSWNRYEASIIAGKELAKNIDFTLSIKVGDSKGQDYYFSEFDSSTTNYGKAIGIDWEKYYNIHTTLSYDNFTLNYFFNSRSKAIPTAPWNTLFNDPLTKTEDTRSYISISHSAEIANSMSISSNIFYDYFNYYGLYPYEGIKQYDKNVGEWVGADIKFLWDIVSNNRLIAGVEAKHSFRADYKLWDEDSVYFNKNFPYTIVSLYIQDQYQVLENFGITLGVRHDQYSTVGSATSPRLALVFNPSVSSAVKLLYGHAFRAPNIYETEYEDFSTQKKNNNLKPEKMQNAEICYQQELYGSIFFSSSLFYYKIQNLIDQYEDVNDGLLQFQNKEDAIGTGVEAEISYRSRFGLWSYIGYSHQLLRDEETLERMTNAPAHILKFGASYKFADCISLAFESVCESSRITIHRTKTDAFILSNISMNWKPNFKNGGLGTDMLNRLHLSLKVYNIFDTEFYLPGGYEHRQNAILQNGRNFSFDFTINL